MDILVTVMEMGVASENRAEEGHRKLRNWLWKLLGWTF
jgi:hypothetical protein